MGVSKDTPIWVVTRAINAYDQEGDYFVCAFNRKPTFKDGKW